MLDSNSGINSEYSNTVKINPLNSYGLPLEITGFTIETSSAEHEHTKSLIIEQAYATLADFELKINSPTN